MDFELQITDLGSTVMFGNGGQKRGGSGPLIPDLGVQGPHGAE